MSLMEFDDALVAFDPVLGLEVHVELNTASKMFCGCANAFGAEPDRNVATACFEPSNFLTVLGTHLMTMRCHKRPIDICDD